MRLDFAFLAQAADFLTSDDKLAAWGIGIDGIEASRMPFQAPPMTLVARILLMPDESERGHTYGVTVIGPQGDEKSLCENEPLSTKHLVKDQPSGSNLVVSLTVVYMNPGSYRFRLFIDGEMSKEIPLHVGYPAELAPNLSLTEGAANG